MSIVDYNNPIVKYERELAERKNRGPSIFRTKEQHQNFQKSPFMQKIREHQMAVYNANNRRDEERARTDPEFNPRDDDFDAPPVRPFDHNENYYKYLGIKEAATTDEVRRAYKKMCLKYHPDKLRQTGAKIKTGKKHDAELEAEEAKETFLSIQEAFEILSDQATRRQYDRSRISENELDKQYDHRKERARERKENEWKPPPTWKPKKKDILAKGRTPKTPPKVVEVPCKLDDVVDGCDRTVTFERLVVGRTGKLHAQKKTVHVTVRRGELASKSWTFPGEAGVASVDAEAGDLVLRLRVDAVPGIRRVGVDLEAERVVDCGHVRPGGLFSAAVATVRGATVVACGRAPDLRGRRGDLVAGKLVLTVRVPNEGVPLVDAPHKRGCLVVKFAFGAGAAEAAMEGAPPRPKKLADRDAARATRRVFETVALRARRNDHGVAGTFVVADAYQPRRAQPLRKKDGRDVAAPPDLPVKSVLAGPECRICAASLRFASEDPDRPRGAAEAFLFGAAWFTLKWAPTLRPRLAEAPEAFADWKPATIAADPDSADFAEPKRADAAPALPSYGSAVMVEADETAGMDDDMKDRHLARKRKEKAARDRAVAAEKAKISSLRGRDRPPPEEEAASPRSVADRDDPLEGLSRLQYKKADERRRRQAMNDAEGSTVPAFKAPVIPVTREDDVLLHRTSSEAPRFHAISNERRDIAVAGNSGAAVRSGPTVDSNKLGELAKGEVVSYTGNQCLCDGKPRVEIDRPMKGWISLKLCGPVPNKGEPDDDDGGLE